MRAVVTRVTSASVVIDGETVGKIGNGFLVLLGVRTDDTQAQAKRLADKLCGLRVFEDENGKMNRNLAGLNILIAEDNDINWEIISTMLSMFGITSERAENGRICVEKMAEATEGRYDLIFMDVQMPEMNGLDATRHIRKQENRWAASIPIIAMTADAFSENVAECLQAGMNGHIAKPIDLKLVVKEIRRIKEEKK